MSNIEEKYKSIAIAPEQEFADAIPVMYAALIEYVTKIIPLMPEHVWQTEEGKECLCLSGVTKQRLGRPVNNIG